MQKIKKSEFPKMSKSTGFSLFFKREMELIYLLELKSTEMIRKLQYVIKYGPLKNAMEQYLDVSNGHISCLLDFGIKSSRISIENRRTTELLIHPLSRSLDAIGDKVKIKEIALVTGIQRIIFYEIAIYRSLCTAARKMDKFEWAAAFNEMLKEKQINDSLLSEIALSGIYKAAIEE